MTETVINVELRGGNWDAFSATEPETLVCGAAGTGKSRAALEKVHYLSQRYPGARSLMIRKTFQSLKGAGLVTYNEQVLHPSDGVKFHNGNNEIPPQYQYPNGSVVLVGGLDDPLKVMSQDYDFIYAQEATDLTMTDWQALSIRKRRGAISMKNGAPFNQLLGDCNPAAPSHWLKLRCDEGKTRLITSLPENNPAYFDKNGTMTPRGALYIATLENLSGVMYRRYRLGEWAAAEGRVYDSWDDQIGIVDRFIIPDDWLRFRAIDFGYANPFVCFDDQTEILTPSGWSSFDDLPKGGEVASINPATKAIEWQTPTAYIKQKYSGPMITSQSDEQGANFSVTPNHRMVVANRKSGIWRFENASSLERLGDSSIPTGWSEVGMDDDGEFIRIGTSEINRQSFSRFLGLFIAEGCLHKNGAIRIAQKNFKNEVRAILTNVGFGWSEYENKNGVVDFRVHNPDLLKKIQEWGLSVKSDQKRIPQEVLSWGVSSLKALMEGLMLGDGRKSLRDDDGRVVRTEAYFTSSKGLADDVQQLASLMGRSSKITSSITISGFTGLPIEMFKVSLHVAQQAHIGTLTLETTRYDGYVHCVTVPNAMLVVRRNGRPMVCGNCQWWALSPRDEMFMYRELYMSGKLVEDHAETINKYTGGEKIAFTVADHDAEGRATLNKMGIRTKPATKYIQEGIQAVEERIRPNLEGHRRLFVMRDSLIEVDLALKKAGKPTSFTEEINNYLWLADINGSKPVKETPQGFNDHAMDCARYAVMAAKRAKKRFVAPGSLMKESLWRTQRIANGLYRT